MELKEFIADQVQVLKDFEHHWEHLVAKGKARTRFLPEQRWKDELATFMERYTDGEPKTQEQERSSQGRDSNRRRNREAA
jgi:hypothetical protein